MRARLATRPVYRPKIIARWITKCKRCAARSARRTPPGSGRPPAAAACGKRRAKRGCGKRRWRLAAHRLREAPPGPPARRVRYSTPHSHRADSPYSDAESGVFPQGPQAPLPAGSRRRRPPPAGSRRRPAASRRRTAASRGSPWAAPARCGAPPLLPAPAQCLVQLHGRGELLQLRLTQRQLRVEQAPLRIEDVQVARDARLVAQLGELQRAAERYGLRFLRDPLVPRRAHSRQCVTCLTQRGERGLLVRRPRFLRTSSRRALLVLQ